MHFRPLARFLPVLLLSATTTAGAAAQELIDVPLPGGDTRAQANAVSANGQVVVGWSGLNGVTLPATFSFDGSVDKFVDSGLLNPQYYSSQALSVSDSGAVIVGQATFTGGRAEAFRHTAGGTERLGFLNGGTLSKAAGVSGDGSLIVGSATDGNAGNATRAVLWSGGNGTIRALDILSGGYDAEANGVSGDASVIVGSAYTGFFQPHAVKWDPTDGSITDLGTLHGGLQSFAYATSDDGSVIVGESLDGATGTTHAFRWTTASGTMASIDPLVRSSMAYDVSGDGLVIVGKFSTNNGYTAFRHTDGDGMISVEQWLRNNGATVSDGITMAAYGTNCDGSVVVGQTQSYHAFIARVPSSSACLTAATDSGTSTGGGSSSGSEGSGSSGSGGEGSGSSGSGNSGGGSTAGIITVDDLSQSLGNTGAVNNVVVNATGTDLNGAGSRPLDRRAAVNRNIVWATGDIGRDDHGQRDGALALGEAGFGHNFGPLQVNVALGASGLDEKTAYGGRTTTRGGFGKVEAIAPLASAGNGTLWGVLTGVAMFGSANITRNYLDNGGRIDSSHGSTGLSSFGTRARIEWENALPHVSPYGELALTRTCLDAYGETGGAFPASFNQLCDTATEARIGADATVPLMTALDFIATAEAVHRFEAAGSAVSGQVAGLGPFNIGGAIYQQTWLRGGAGLAYHNGSSTLSLMGNATTKGETPSAWLSLSWRHQM